MRSGGPPGGTIVTLLGAPRVGPLCVPPCPRWVAGQSPSIQPTLPVNHGW